ncbi:hypothetical protein [Psychrobacter sp.]|uniref:hypothetical protein n=1 Tax=Psychrobacter sp. TaxID=56811 RepID=UPI0026472A2C|nr:hypothetical protein [Psychrobacter sp.]MDN6275593.1 hypothetical protein [Psychrobacter sp.]MDN6308001.1 hypothetical protein [Psychrobacter sp.]
MKKSVLNTVLSTALIAALGLGISACGGHGDDHAVASKDRVDEASALARENAPAPEEMDFPETAPVVATEGAETTDATATEAEGTDTTEAAVEGEDSEAEATDTAETGAEAEPVAE